MNPPPELSLFEIIESRQALDLSIDAEFDGLPVSPKRKRIYDWTRRKYRTVTVLDCGGKRQQAPAPELGPDKYAPPKPPQKAPKTDQIIAYLNDNGPSTLRQVAEGTGMPLKKVRSLVSRNRKFEGFYATREAKSSNAEMTWTVREEQT